VADSASGTQVIEAVIVPCSEMEILDSNTIVVDLGPGSKISGEIRVKILSNTPWNLFVSADPLSTGGENPKTVPPEDFAYTSSYSPSEKNVEVVDTPIQFSSDPTFLAKGLDSTTGDNGIIVTLKYTINCSYDLEPGTYSTTVNFLLSQDI
jgi:hypothetical protein